MPNYTKEQRYSKVQFIAWGIYTGPVYDYYQKNAIEYPGITYPRSEPRLNVLSQFIDIKARVAFTKLAINAALEHASPDEETLKIFVAPEFLYRGAAGAYLFDLLNGWEEPSDPNTKTWAQEMMIPPPYDRKWSGLFGELREMVRQETFKDWLFIFGSAVGAAFKTQNGQVVNGDASAWNLSMIQCGGDTQTRQEACYFTQKHLKSTIDFIAFNQMHPGRFSDESTEHTTDPNKVILDRLMQEDPLPHEVGGALFRFPHLIGVDGNMLQFGLEICLDHAQPGRLATSGVPVDIQLVPSCGMVLLENSLSLASREGTYTHSYAFNCDGLTSLDGTQLGGHAQVWSGNDGGDPLYPSRHLEEVNNSVKAPPGDPSDDLGTYQTYPVPGVTDMSSLQVPPDVQTRLEINLSTMYADRLWYSEWGLPLGTNSHQLFFPRGAGFVHVMSVQPL